MDWAKLDTVQGLDWAGKESTYDPNRMTFLVCEEYKVLVECLRDKLSQVWQGCRLAMEIDRPNYPSLHNQWSELGYW